MSARSETPTCRSCRFHLPEPDRCCHLPPQGITSDGQAVWPRLPADFARTRSCGSYDVAESALAVKMTAAKTGAKTGRRPSNRTSRQHCRGLTPKGRKCRRAPLDGGEFCKRCQGAIDAAGPAAEVAAEVVEVQLDNRASAETSTKTGFGSGYPDERRCTGTMQNGGRCTQRRDKSPGGADRCYRHPRREETALNGAAQSDAAASEQAAS